MMPGNVARARRIAIALIAATTFLGGCATTQSKVDPFEPWNRAMFEVNDVVDGKIAKPIAEAAGFKFWKPLIWDKCTIGMGYHYRARYEFVLFFEKGKRKLNDLGIADVLTAPRVRGGYPAEKPVALSETLILQSSSAGDIVADPFMGSGSVGVAALKLSRRFLGNDVSDSALAHSRARFTQMGGQEGSLIPAVSADSPGQRRLALVLP